MPEDERSPDDPAVHYLLGRLLASPQAQKREFSRAVELDEDFPWGHYGLAFLDEIAGRFDAALERYDRAVALSPERALFASRRVHDC